MKRQMFFATAFSAALAVGAAAQTGTGTGTGTSAQQDTRAPQVTMTGCLERSAAGTAGTSGTGTSGTGTASSAAGGGFILSNAMAGSGSSGSATSGTSGTGTGTSSSSAAGAKYRLMGGDQEDLTKYVNSKVEIRGTIDRSSASSSGAASGTGTGTGTGTSASGQSDQNLPTLRVTSVKQVAASCAGGN